MRSALRWSAGLFLILVSVAHSQPRQSVVKEAWDAVYLADTKAGFVHTTVQEIDGDGQKLLRTTIELDLSVRRFNDVARMRQVSGSEETKEGKVTGVFMRQFLGKEQQLVLTGTVKNNHLQYKVHGNTELTKEVPWDDDVIGLYRELNLFKDRAVKPGDQFTYRHYEPMLAYVVTVRVAVKDYEVVETKGGKKRLLRIDTIPDKIQNAQLPPTTFWIDAKGEVVRSQSEMPGLGKFVSERSNKRDVLRMASGAGASVPSLNTLIRLNRPIPQALDADSVTYRITLPNDDDPATAFAQDNRQSVRNVQGHSFDLVVRAVRSPLPLGKPGTVGEEFLKSNTFINSADPLVRQHARAAVGGETDPWRKAQLIERWVRDNMKILNFTEAMATADHVARTLEGDCSEFSMLAAAMCRAAGVPSRVALGLVYVNHRAQGPLLAYHMWTEVWVNGQWIAIDSTLGRGSIGAAHLKITDNSWYDVQSLKPLLPVMRVMTGKVAVEVVE